MALNPMELMKMRGRLKLFQQQHPKFPAFLKKVNDRALRPGTIVEIKVTSPEGEELISNLRLTADDVETVRIASGLKASS